MKKATLVFLIVTLALLSNAQLQNKTRIAFSANFLRVGYYPAQSFNITLEGAVDENWSIRYEVGFGSSKGDSYRHCPASFQWGVNEIKKGFTDGYHLYGLLLFLIPEGVSYTFKMNDKLVVSPFLDLNSREYFGLLQTDSMASKYSGDAGISCRYDLNPRIYITASGSLTMLEGEGLGGSGNFGLGWKLGRIYPKRSEGAPTPEF